MKKTLLISNLLIIAVLFGVAYRENLNMDWQKYQKKYKKELTRMAITDKEKTTANNYKVQMRQIVLPEFNKADRCVTCHVGMEDARMANMPNPYKSHPGDYLETHDINKVGCTFCHDGQGRAITTDDAHAQSTHKYWEKPILAKPFIESTCSRCHVNTLDQTPNYNYGKQLFKDMGCISCHKVGATGGNVGPELTNIGNASFHMKAPIPQNRDEYLNEFHENVNLAYLYESVTTPKAQPAETTMPDFGLKDAQKEALALITFLKSFSKERRVMDVGIKISPVATDVSQVASLEQIASQDFSSMIDAQLAEEEAMIQQKRAGADIRKGKDLFQGKQRFFNGGPSCVSCHNVKSDKLVIGGGSLGKDLTSSFSTMGEEGITAALKNSSHAVMKQPYAEKPLTDDEIFALTAFLEKVDGEKHSQRPRGYALKMLGNGILGLLVFLGIYSFYWARSKKD